MFFRSVKHRINNCPGDRYFSIYSFRPLFQTLTGCILPLHTSMIENAHTVPMPPTSDPSFFTIAWYKYHPDIVFISLFSRKQEDYWLPLPYFFLSGRVSWTILQYSWTMPHLGRQWPAWTSATHPHMLCSILMPFPASVLSNYLRSILCRSEEKWFSIPRSYLSFPVFLLSFSSSLIFAARAGPRMSQPCPHVGNMISVLNCHFLIVFIYEHYLTPRISPMATFAVFHTSLYADATGEPPSVTVYLGDFFHIDDTLQDFISGISFPSGKIPSTIAKELQEAMLSLTFSHDIS